MNNFQIFLSTKVQNAGKLAAIGDFLLTPARNLFCGKTVRIVPKEALFEVNHVPSYHKMGGSRYCEFDNSLTSSQSSFLKTLVSILLFIPGFLLGSIFKGFSYCYKDTRDKRDLVKQHFTRIDHSIGSAENRLDEEGIKKALEDFAKLPLHQKVNHLTIFAKGVEHESHINRITKETVVDPLRLKDLLLDTDPGIIRLNPKKVILDGARIGHKFGEFISHFDDELIKTKKFKNRKERNLESDRIDSTFVEQYPVKSLEEALEHVPPRMSWSLKRYNAIYVVEKPSEKHI